MQARLLEEVLCVILFLQTQEMCLTLMTSLVKNHLSWKTVLEPSELEIESNEGIYLRVYETLDKHQEVVILGVAGIHLHPLN